MQWVLRKPSYKPFNLDLDGRTDEGTDERSDKQTDERTDGRKNKRTDGRNNGQTDRQTNKRMRSLLQAPPALQGHLKMSANLGALNLEKS